MDDPFSPPLMAKVIAGVGGFVGGATFMAFYKPKGVWDAAVRSSISTTTAIIGAVPLLDYLGLKMDMDHIMMSGAVIGFCAWSVLSIAARFLMEVQDEKTNIKMPGFIERK